MPKSLFAKFKNCLRASCIELCKIVEVLINQSK